MIREEIIKLIYHGKIIQLVVIFHELYHFIVKYDILNGVNNENITKILKEKLVSKEEIFYKINNYGVLYEEKYADINGLYEFLYLMNRLNINLSKKHIRSLGHFYEETLELLNYNKRVIEGESCRQDLYELFDSLIIDLPEWLEYPQIDLRYSISKEKCKSYLQKCNRNY